MDNYNVVIPGGGSNALSPMALMALQQRSQLGEGNLAYKEQMLALKQQQVDNALANAGAGRAKSDYELNQMKAVRDVLANRVSPAVVGVPGIAYSGTGVSTDPNEGLYNKLLGTGDIPSANAYLTGQNTAATTGETNARTAGLNIDNISKQYKAENDALAQVAANAEHITDSDTLLAVNAALHGPNSPLKSMFDRMGITPEKSQADLQQVIAKQGFDKALSLFSQGAAKTLEAHNADLKSQADVSQSNATTANTVATGQRAADAETLSKPTQISLGDRIVIVEGNPRLPNYNQELTTLKMGAAPKEATPPAPSNVSRLMDELASVLKTDPNNAERIATLKTAISKESGDAKLAAQSNIKLEPGQKLDDNGNIVNMPNSRIDAQQRKAHAQDAKKIETVNVSTDSTLSNIDQILDPKKSSDFDANFGYGSSLTSKTPGARDVAAKIDNIKAALKSLGLEDFRVNGSIGAMTEKEWPIVQDRIAALKDNMSPEAARQTLADIKQRLSMMRNIAHDSYDNQWGASQYYKSDLTKNSTTNIFNAADAIIGGK